MTNKDFKKTLDELLRPFGFSNKGNLWTLETDELEKLIYLQKSNYGNLYYLNYGYNIKGLIYDEVTMHVGNGLSQSEAFDLENQLEPIDRIYQLERIILNELLPELEKVNTELELIDLLKKEPHLNDVPLLVKDYFKLN
ncbi:MAG: DUF4304 domain-containing protein [Cyclobacteriaceae bacterium]|nr:DUF4304 domain-containing protein [Cyclobacteriaceae bacterium]